MNVVPKIQYDNAADDLSHDDSRSIPRDSNNVIQLGSSPVRDAPKRRSLLVFLDKTKQRLRSPSPSKNSRDVSHDSSRDTSSESRDQPLLFKSPFREKKVDPKVQKLLDSFVYTETTPNEAELKLASNQHLWSDKARRLLGIEPQQVESRTLQSGFSPQQEHNHDSLASHGSDLADHLNTSLGMARTTSTHVGSTTAAGNSSGTASHRLSGYGYRALSGEPQERHDSGYQSRGDTCERVGPGLGGGPPGVHIGSPVRGATTSLSPPGGLNARDTSPSRTAGTYSGNEVRMSQVGQTSPERGHASHMSQSSHVSHTSHTSHASQSSQPKIDVITTITTLQEDGKLNEAHKLLAETSKTSDSPSIQLMYGLSLRHGWGGHKDCDSAFLHILKAAQIASSLEVDDANTIAARQYNKSTRRTFSQSLYELGNCYVYSWGVTGCPEVGQMYYECAAWLGDEDAQEQRGRYLCNSKKFPEKKTGAHWLRIVAGKGYSAGDSWIWKEKYD